jgi:hypothetical protein
LLEVHVSAFPASRLAFVALKAARALTDFIRTTFEGPSAKYRPEEHYMRGPGPKWREKHMFDVTTRDL